MRALRGNKVSMIFQEPMSSLNPVYTIGQQITEILHLHNRIAKAEAMTRAEALLEEVQIPEPRRGSSSIRTSSRAASASAS